MCIAWLRLRMSITGERRAMMVNEWCQVGVRHAKDAPWGFLEDGVNEWRMLSSSLAPPSFIPRARTVADSDAVCPSVNEPESSSPASASF